MLPTMGSHIKSGFSGFYDSEKREFRESHLVTNPASYWVLFGMGLKQKWLWL